MSRVLCAGLYADIPHFISLCFIACHRCVFCKLKARPFIIRKITTHHGRGPLYGGGPLFRDLESNQQYPHVCLYWEPPVLKDSQQMTNSPCCSSPGPPWGKYLLSPNQVLHTLPRLQVVFTQYMLSERHPHSLLIVFRC